MLIPRIFVAIAVATSFSVLAGCDSGSATSVLEDADMSAIEAYEKAEAEEQAMLEGQMTDAIE